MADLSISTDELITLIECLSKDARMEWLVQEPQFHCATHSLCKIKADLEKGYEISPEQKTYVTRVLRNMRRIYPHYEKLTVNGIEADVFFVYRTDIPIIDDEGEGDNCNIF